MSTISVVIPSSKATPRLKAWEAVFQQKISLIDKSKSGCLLRVVPDRVSWDEFKDVVRAEWIIWENNLTENSGCLVILFAGLAFFDYDDATFWPSFAASIGASIIDSNRQSRIRSSYLDACELLDLPVLKRNGSNDYVGSAITHIGIPLSLWDSFVEICEWSLSHENWKQLPDSDWEQILSRRVGSKKRLGKFLVNGRVIATQFIQEMHDAREVMEGHPEWSIDDLSKVVFLRAEYFDEVPETAEFINPNNPESLLKGRVRIVWNDVQGSLCVQLPPVANGRLPARWSIAGIEQDAISNPDDIVLNGAALKESLPISLIAGSQADRKSLQGVTPWALFDQDDGDLIRTKHREFLPIENCVIISKEKLEDVKAIGFDEEYYSLNQKNIFPDRTEYYLTRIVPTGRSELSFRCAGHAEHLQFRARSKIEARFFAGVGRHAASFSRIYEAGRYWVTKEGLPIPCVTIPVGYFGNPASAVSKLFRVQITNASEKTYPAAGKWEKIGADEDREYYFWQWGRPPFLDTVPGGVTSFRDLHKIVKPLELSGRCKVSIAATSLGIKFSYEMVFQKVKWEVANAWKDFPSQYLLWSLLCQSPRGMGWDDLLLAKSAILPANSRIVYGHLRRYMEAGLLQKKGRRWIIRATRAVLTVKGEEVSLQFCGDPTILWSLYRQMFNIVSNHKLPPLQVVAKRGQLPFLLSVWSKSLTKDLNHILSKKGVCIAANLWRS